MTISFGIGPVVRSQSLPGNETHEITESAFFSLEEIEVIATEEYSEAYEALLRDPVRINENEPLELARLFFLTHEQLNNLFMYIVYHGPMLSVYELMAVEGISSELARKLAAAITLETRLPLPWAASVIEETRLKQEYKVNMTGRVDEIFNSSMPAQADAMNAVSPMRLRMRYGLKASNGIDLAIAGETDPGEAFPFSRNSQGMDFYSAYFAYRGHGLLKKVVLGDYHLSAGQGLWLWNAYIPQMATMGNGGWMLASKGLSPVARSSEGSFFRGVAACLQYKRFFIIPFFSAAGQSAQSMTPGSCAGFYAACLWDRLEIGAGWIKYKTEVITRFNLKEGIGRNILDMKGNMPGMNVKFRNGAAVFYGEAGLVSLPAWTPRWMIGMEWKFNPSMGISMQYYRYPNGDDTPGMSFSFGGKALNNIHGARVGLRFHTSDKMYWMAGLSYVEAMPDPGSLYGMGKSIVSMISATYIARNGLSLAFRFRYRSSIMQQSTLNYGHQGSGEPGRYDLQIVIKPGNNIPYECKLLMLADQQDGKAWKYAFLLFQQARINLCHERIRLNLSHVLFDTDSWDQRLYVNNSLVTFTGGFQALSGQGGKSCLHVDVSLLRFLRCAAFVSRLSYFDRGSIGSGTSVVPGNTRTDLGLQLIFNW